MSEQEKPRGNPGWIKGGSSPNPGGRPKNAFALSNLIRERVDPQELVEVALSIARDSEVDEKIRLQALAFLADRGWIKPPTISAKRVETVSSVAGLLPANWNELSPAARASYLDQMPRMLPEAEGVDQ